MCNIGNVSLLLDQGARAEDVFVASLFDLEGDRLYDDAFGYCTGMLQEADEEDLVLPLDVTFAIDEMGSPGRLSKPDDGRSAYRKIATGLTKVPLRSAFRKRASSRNNETAGRVLCAAHPNLSTISPQSHHNLHLISPCPRLELVLISRRSYPPPAAHRRADFRAGATTVVAVNRLQRPAIVRQPSEETTFTPWLLVQRFVQLLRRARGASESQAGFMRPVADVSPWREEHVKLLNRFVPVNGARRQTLTLIAPPNTLLAHTLLALPFQWYTAVDCRPSSDYHRVTLRLIP